MFQSSFSQEGITLLSPARPGTKLEESSVEPLVFTPRPVPTPLSVVAPVRRPQAPRGKRVFDIFCSAMALAILSPLLVAVWVLVKLTSRGPGIYWSQRVGFGGEVFLMPKFRSMCVESPTCAREAMPDAANNVTRFGEFIRRSSIDELPQLWSVLVGDMSLIGPRPLLGNDPTTQLRKIHYPEIFTVRPGITGLAQVNGRNHVHGHRKGRYDALYAKRCSARMDAFILLRTIRVVLSANDIL